MSLIIVLGALVFLMVVAYRGGSVILFAPVAALGAVFLTDPALVLPMSTGLYMDRTAAFIKLYFPVFVLGAVFGKLMELSGFAKSIAACTIRLVGAERTILSIVVLCALLTYGGVSLFVVVFAAYPFAEDLFRRSDIPKRLIPGTIALGAFTFTMDCLPGSPQIQNIIPTTYFKTNLYAAPWLGTIGAVFILTAGLFYLDLRRRQAAAAGEGFGEPPVGGAAAPHDEGALAHPAAAMLPLLMVGGANLFFAWAIPQAYGASHAFVPAAVGDPPPVVQDVVKVGAVWAVEAALVVGIVSVLALAWPTLTGRLSEGLKPAVGGALLASANTASEYGFGAVVAALPGFRVIAEFLRTIPDPLVNEAVTVTSLAGITGSASGGMSIALAAMSETFIANAQAAGVSMEVLHRVAAMASGGMDTLPHNGAVITLLTVTGLTHRQAYQDIFAVTLIKTAAVFVVIGVYRVTGLV